VRNSETSRYFCSGQHAQILARSDVANGPSGRTKRFLGERPRALNVGHDGFILG